MEREGVLEGIEQGSLAPKYGCGEGGSPGRLPRSGCRGAMAEEPVEITWTMELEVVGN